MLGCGIYPRCESAVLGPGRFFTLDKAPPLADLPTLTHTHTWDVRKRVWRRNPTVPGSMSVRVEEEDTGMDLLVAARHLGPTAGLRAGLELLLRQDTRSVSLVIPGSVPRISRRPLTGLTARTMVVRTGCLAFALGLAVKK